MKSATPSFGLIIIGDEIVSSKRQDQHLQNANEIFKPLGLTIDWIRILRDNPELLVKHLTQTFLSDDVVFCFGGIGATPDDRTRQSAALALGVPLKAHPEAVSAIEEQFGDAAYPQRVKMANFPQGSRIIPNFYNKVPGFSIKNHHFMPGFPMMSKPMMSWTLDKYYHHYFQTPKIELSILMTQTSENDWIVFMEDFEKKFSQLRLFSLPRIDSEGQRSIELGVEGHPPMVDEGMKFIIKAAKKINVNFKKKHIQQLKD